MRILAIETSCDETAVAIVDATGDERDARFHILGNALVTQIELHREFGGVFPALAKREHAKNLVPVLEASLEEAEMLREDTQSIPQDLHDRIAALLEREPELSEQLIEFLSENEKPALDAIAVTAGPGLEPALWVGINLAKALALAWNLPIVSVNHMEGHTLSALARKDESDESILTIRDVAMPTLALLISGGHTELLLMEPWLSYRLIGQTRDDAVGEAFDKVARMLGLPYPGGPEISKLAEAARHEPDGFADGIELPRPMMNDGSCDFSFAGLKTAVLYLMKKYPDISDEDRKRFAVAFEDAAADVLWEKTSRALTETAAETLVLGGGVSANAHIRRVFAEKIESEHPQVSLRIPPFDLTTDNAVMIALAGFYHAARSDFTDPAALAADGNRSLA
jgi:N6-L-threonylcarbamoyladenine synthase